MKYLLLLILSPLLFAFGSLSKDNNTEQLNKYIEITHVVKSGDRINQMLIVEDSLMLETFDYSKYKYPNLISKIVISETDFEKLIQYILNVKQDIQLNLRNDLYIHINGYGDSISKRQITIYGNTIESEYIFNLLFPLEKGR